MKLVNGYSWRKILLIVVCICLMGGHSGCQSTHMAKEFKEFIHREAAESQALAIANCNAPEYELFKSRFHPPFWTVNYQLSDGRKAYVSLDLYGNLIKTDGLPVQKSQNQKKLACREIAPTEAKAIASVYIQNCTDMIQNTYVDYHLAQWEIMLNMKNMPTERTHWRSSDQFFVTVKFREDGAILHPRWLGCQ